MIKISIITPNYNHGLFLEEAIQSVMGQTNPPSEYIIIDDASTDGSREIIDKYASLYSFIRPIYHRKNEGILSTLNQGLKEAKGDYILFLSADDFLGKNILETYKHFLKKYPSVGFCCALTYKLLEDQSQPELYNPQANFPSGYLSPTHAKKLIYKHAAWFCGNTVLLNRKSALENGGFNPDLLSYTDGFLYMTLALKYGLVYIDKPLATYRRQETSFSTDTYRNLTKLKNIRKKALKLMKNENIYDASFTKRWENRWLYLEYNALLLSQNLNWHKFFKFLASSLGFLFYRWYDIFNIRLIDVYSFIRACSRYSQ